MAITWDLTITPISIRDKQASILATRTDDSDESVTTYEVNKATIDTETMSNNMWIIDEIWGKHQIALNKESAIAGFINDLKTAGKTNLEGRE